MDRQECVDKIAEYLYSFTKGTYGIFLDRDGNEYERMVTLDDERGRAGDIISAREEGIYNRETNDYWGVLMRSVNPIRGWFEEYSGHKDAPLHKSNHVISIKRSKESEDNYRKRRIAEKANKFKQGGLW